MIDAEQEIRQYDLGKEAEMMLQPYFEMLDSKNIVTEMALSQMGSWFVPVEMKCFPSGS